MKFFGDFVLSHVGIDEVKVELFVLILLIELRDDGACDVEHVTKHDRGEKHDDRGEEHLHERSCEVRTRCEECERPVHGFQVELIPDVVACQAIVVPGGFVSEYFQFELADEVPQAGDDVTEDNDF